jgi:hypothetical protein
VRSASLSVIVFLVAVATSACVGDAIQQSHIESNVPPPAEFDRVLQRDSDAYFGTALARSAHVRYEMLREGATQSGVAYPKFYVWLVAPLAGGETREGAARLAAIDKQRFEVTDFVTEEQVRRDPEGLSLIFPRPVCDRIHAKLGIK